MRSAIDGFLELSVFGSFSRLGILIRRKIFDWTSVSDWSLVGKTILVTGPTSGLGRVTAVALARLGARVILVGRSVERLGQVHDYLVAAHGEDRFPIVVADMGSLASVRAAVTEILEREARLDLIVDNAGGIFLERTMSPDGIEATFAISVVGPFALVDGLLPLMERTGGGRIIAVTSGGMYTQALDLDDLGSQRVAYTGALAYARAKRAQTALVRERARRLALSGSSVTINAMHPGWADTPGLADTLPTFHRLMGSFLRSPEEGADTIVWLAADPAAARLSGGLFLDRRPRPFDRVPTTRVSAADRRRLWDAVAGLAGISSGAPAD